MAKVDLKSSYRHVPLSESSQRFTSLKWKFKGDKEHTYLMDTRLPFGASLSVGIFHRLTQSVCRMLQRQGIQAVICYLDDFLSTPKRLMTHYVPCNA